MDMCEGSTPAAPGRGDAATPVPTLPTTCSASPRGVPAGAASDACASAADAPSSSAAYLRVAVYLLQTRMARSHLERPKHTLNDN